MTSSTLQVGWNVARGVVMLRSPDDEGRPDIIQEMTAEAAIKVAEAIDAWGEQDVAIRGSVALTVMNAKRFMVHDVSLEAAKKLAKELREGAEEIVGGSHDGQAEATRFRNRPLRGRPRAARLR